MSIRYTNGKPISRKVIGCLQYLSKVGVMGRETWYEHFGIGSKRWMQKQLKQLLALKMIKEHSSQLGDHFVLGDEGIEIIKELKWTFVSPVQPRQFRHDEIVARGLWKLQSQSLCNEWLSEKELMTGIHKEFLIKEGEGQSKYPDAIFKVLIRDKYRTVALEYERTGKSSHRYRTILWSYNYITSVSLVLFIVEDETIKKRIKAALRALGSVQLVERLAFMSAKEWIDNPLRAAIELRSKNTSFENLQGKEAA
jgi:hypothetical protein